MEIKLGWPESILWHIICNMLSSKSCLTKTLNPCAAILRRRQHFTKTFPESQTQSRQASLTCFALKKKTSTLNSLKHHFSRTWVLNQAPLSKNIMSILKDFQEYINAKDQPFLEEASHSRQRNHQLLEGHIFWDLQSAANMLMGSKHSRTKKHILCNTWCHR